MKKGVELSIIQTPIWINFACPHCEEELSVDFDKFGYGLSELLNDDVCFKCPLCEGELMADDVILD